MKKKIIFYLFLIGVAVGYYFYKKNQNKNLKIEIEFLIKKASTNSSESEKILNNTLKYEKAAMGQAYLNIINNNYKKSKIESLTKIDFDKFEKNIIKNLENSKNSLSQKCNLKNKTSYLEDLSLKV